MNIRPNTGIDSLLGTCYQHSQESNSDSGSNKNKKITNTQDRKKFPMLGSPKDSADQIHSSPEKEPESRNEKGLKSITKATGSEPVSHFSSNNFLNGPIEEDKQEEM